MGSFYWRVLSSPLLSRPLKRPKSSIANTSRRAKRRKTSHRGEAPVQRPTQTVVREESEGPSCSCSLHQVFLSHSGHQKSFVEQLFLDLQRENISCFFDKDPQSLPKGEEFPPRLFKAARECRVGVVVLSDEFIASKWPMLELCEFVRAKNSTDGKLKILPCFFRLSLQPLCQKLQNKESLKRCWQELLKDRKRTIDLDEWVDALKALRSINGVVHYEQENEVDYRAKIVSSIRSLLPPKRPYDESQLQGKQRLCQGWCLFNQRMMFNGKVFLAIDNISDLEESIDEAQKYLRAVRSAGNQKDAFNWLALACDTNVEHIKFAIVQLKRKGFVETIMESGIQAYIHDLHIEFAANKADGAAEYISLKDRFDIPACL